jgi:hypothetical protein
MLSVSIQLVCFASNCLFRTLIRKISVAEICAIANDWHAEHSCAWAESTSRLLRSNNMNSSFCIFYCLRWNELTSNPLQVAVASTSRTSQSSSHCRPFLLESCFCKWRAFSTSQEAVLQVDSWKVQLRWGMSTSWLEFLDSSEEELMSLWQCLHKLPSILSVSHTWLGRA